MPRHIYIHIYICIYTSVVFRLNFIDKRISPRKDPPRLLRQDARARKYLSYSRFTRSRRRSVYNGLKQTSGRERERGREGERGSEIATQRMSPPRLTRTSAPGRAYVNSRFRTWEREREGKREGKVISRDPRAPDICPQTYTRQACMFVCGCVQGFRERARSQLTAILPDPRLVAVYVVRAAFKMHARAAS